MALTAILAGIAAVYLISPYGNALQTVGSRRVNLRRMTAGLAGIAIAQIPLINYLNTKAADGGFAGSPWYEIPMSVAIAAFTAVVFAFVVYRSWPAVAGNRAMQLAPIALSGFVIICGAAYFFGFIEQARAVRYDVVMEGPYRGSIVAWIAGEDYLTCDADLQRHTVSHRCVLGKIDKAPLRFEERKVGPLRFRSSP